ncbi:DUF2147 domain-containing protein [Flexibacterium corallicola]|uniref:DUF2147 domain-containing protein n=1 Tax=Flexibacterium corallicola TaxID=3037259 RepID=UPI00286EFE0B|nr:DUF2147 domain-containing protein [Pseudovibrio sp. M1P-2-3]
MKTQLKALGLGLILSASIAGASQAAGPEGVWKRSNGNAKIQMYSCGSAICGKIVWLKNPRKDIKNPSKSLQSRELVGLNIVQGMKPNGSNEWAGKIYNAEDGKTYKGKMKLVSANELKLSGCALGGLICKGDIWNRSK